MKILIIGNGYIGQRCQETWPEEATICNKYIRTVNDALKILETEQPDVVLNAAGVVGKPNVDWCEDHVLETVQGNTILPLLLAEACNQKQIYLLHIGTGCIFYGTSPHGGPWTEDDFGNPSAVYTRSKYAADLALSTFANVGIARIRMPLDDRPGPSNLIDKLIGFDQVVDVENSITVVSDMIEVFHRLLRLQASGIFHVTNPGAIKHREIISLYEQIVDSSHKNEWISEEDLLDRGLVLKKRSNNVMASVNLPALGINMRPVHIAVRQTLEKYRENLK